MKKQITQRASNKNFKCQIFFTMISFIHAKIYMAFEIILLNLFTHEDLLYRKLNNSKHPPVCKEFTTMDYLRLLVKMEHLLCLNRSARDGSWTISVKEVLYSTQTRQASSGFQQPNLKLQLFQAPNDWCNLSHYSIWWGTDITRKGQKAN